MRLRLDNLLLVAILCLCGNAFAEIQIDTTRKSAFDYACVDVSGILPLTNHQRLGKAQAVCTERALADPEGTYEVQGGRWRISVQTDQPPAVNPNVVFSVNVACVPSLESIQPLATFDVAQCVTGQGAYQVSVDSSLWAVSGTIISAPPSGQGSLKLSINFAADNVAFVMSRLWSVVP